MNVMTYHVIKYATTLQAVISVAVMMGMNWMALLVLVSMHYTLYIINIPIVKYMLCNGR